MKQLPEILQQKLLIRQEKNALRVLGKENSLVDFSSNDYLGFSKSQAIFEAAHHYLKENNLMHNGSGGSRLLSGNHSLFGIIESVLSDFHNSSDALIFNSGYDANLGFLSCIPQRGDIILYDELAHASIRDGIQLSNAKSFKFKHNDLSDLEEKTLRFTIDNTTNIYVITESVFSMDGDSPDLIALSKISEKYGLRLVIDEAHAVGVFGENGVGMVSKYELEAQVFARIITFGKAIGCHGAAILGSKKLKEYLINFSRSFIYTTALSPHAIATILSVYKELQQGVEKKKLHQNIQFFKTEASRLSLQNHFIESDSAIQCCIISGNDKVKNVATKLEEKGYDVKPIMSPTIPEGEERLRFCLHSYNSEEEITQVLQLLATFAAE